MTPEQLDGAANVAAFIPFAFNLADTVKEEGNSPEAVNGKEAGR